MMVLLNEQQLKNMKQLAVTTLVGLKNLGFMGFYLLLAAGFLWLFHFVTAPIGGIIFFSAIFTVALAGFASAVVLYHLLVKIFTIFRKRTS